MGPEKDPVGSCGIPQVGPKWKAVDRASCVTIEQEFPCINGVHCWFTVATVYMPEEAETGYTDGALSREAARARADLIVKAVNAHENAWKPGDPRCDDCDNGLEADWQFCPWCGKAPTP